MVKGWKVLFLKTPTIPKKSYNKDRGETNGATRTIRYWPEQTEDGRPSVLWWMRWMRTAPIYVEQKVLP